MVGDLLVIVELGEGKEEAFQNRSERAWQPEDGITRDADDSECLNPLL